MKEVPTAVEKAIFRLLFAERLIAYLEVDASGRIALVGGEKTVFGLDQIEVGDMVEDHFDFLVNLFDSATLPIEMPIMEMPSGLPADVHVFQEDGEIWVLLVHALEKKQQRQVFRQNVNDLSLARHRQSRILNQYLGKEVAERLGQGIENVDSSGERRNLTIMFADIRGFTSYSEKTDPEEIFRTLNIYLGAMIPAVLDLRGVLDKIIGDEVMAIFGMLAEDRDGPNNGLSAAIRMLESVEALNQERDREDKTQLGIGIGIATGPVSLGILGSQDRKSITVIGNHVNLAARLQGMANANQLIIDNNTFNLIDKHKESFTERSLELKGYSELQDVHQLEFHHLSRKGIMGLNE